jgi:hypothetical protein
MLDHESRKPVSAQVRTVAVADEQMGTDQVPVARISDADVTRVVNVLHEQADRLMVDAERMAQRAAETRAMANHQDRQADDLEWRADRLHAQADHLHDDSGR